MSALTKIQAREFLKRMKMSPTTRALARLNSADARALLRRLRIAMKNEQRRFNGGDK